MLLWAQPGHKAMEERGAKSAVRLEQGCKAGWEWLMRRPAPEQRVMMQGPLAWAREQQQSAIWPATELAPWAMMMGRHC